ncbi:eIF2A-related protein [Scytonema sp. PCC 10023]|uniref:nSTAND1 domain-containing NTPase n=1 Tax=Scytonema sp. PCC 10023 TaxID=1680591 RepID=UPI0039C690C9
MPGLKRRLAVVIGINQYFNGIPALKTAVNDASKLAHILETKYQYQVLLLLDNGANYKNLNHLFTAFEQQMLPLADGSKIQIQPNDSIIFYFAGHGIALDALDNADGPSGFLIPQDARLDLEGSLVSMQQLHDALLKLPCRHLLVILDCCFAGAFRWAGNRDVVRSQKMYRERYERFISGCAQQVITSAADDEKAADSLFRFGQRSEYEGHSPFAELLLKGLSGEADYSRDGAITATELYVYIHGELGKTSAKQTPGFCQLKRHDKGEYIFAIPGFKANKLEEAPKLDEKANPYKGLESFEEKDSDKFFGRKALIETLQEFVANHPLTVVLGASGSGKSSLVKAGLIPQLKKQREQWRVLDPIRPGESPFRALNHALERENLPVFGIPNKPTDDLSLEDASKQGNSSDNTLWYEQGLQNLSSNLVAWRKLYPNSKLLLVIDQSEELVTLSRDEVEREMFLKGLARALKAFPDWLRIVLTLRSDFEPQFRETALEPYWSGARFLVPAMTREELRQAIMEPATAKVMYFEPPKLVDQLIDEVVQMPGALPLLSFTLSELYLKYIKSVRQGKRNNRAITQEDYEQLGGVARSLTQRADCEYEELVKLDPAYEQTVRHVMLRMVALSGSELARRQVDLSELEYPEPKNERVKLVIERFASARLLVKGRDIEGNLYVEPAHDALVRGWQKLRTWKDRELASLLLQRELTAIANKWTTSRQDKQAVGLLWDDDPRLPLVKQVFESTDNWLNCIELEFFHSSIQRKRKNLRRLVGSVAGVILGLTGLSIYAFARTVEAQFQTLDALSASSQAYLALNQELDALVESTKAGKLLKNSLAGEILKYFPWIKADTKMRVLMALRQAVYEIHESNRLNGHTNWVSSVSFSPDGQMLATVSEDNTIKLWKRDGKEIKSWQGHNLPALSVSFSPDGKTLVSGSKDKTVKIWKLDGKLAPLTLQGHKDGVNTVRFSPDGKMLVSASRDKTVKLWSKDGKPIATMFGHTNAVNAVSFSPNGSTIASASVDKTVKLWNRDGRLLRSLTGHNSNVIDVNFSRDGKIASASENGIVRLWNHDGALLRQFPQQGGAVTGVDFSPDGKMIATACEDKTVKLWRLDGTLVQTFRGHAQPLTEVRFSPDGRAIASTSRDNTVKLWSVKAKLPFILGRHNSFINYVRYSPDSNTITSVSRDTVKVWSLDGRLRQIQEKNGQIFKVSFSPQGNTLALASSDKTVKLWNLSGKLQQIKGHQDQVYSVTYSPDGQIIASGSKDKTIKLWDKNGKLLNTLKGHQDNIIALSFSPDGQIIASASKDKNIKLWDKNGKLLNTLKGHLGSVMSVSFSPDGQTIASASSDGTVKLWQRDGTLITTLPSHSGWVLDVTFSPDGQTIASASEDKTIKFWSKDGALLGNIQGSDAISSVSFSPDGKKIASGSYDKNLTLWNLDLEDLLIDSCYWLNDYLKTNYHVNAQNRHLCKSTIPVKTSNVNSLH